MKFKAMRGVRAISHVNQLLVTARNRKFPSIAAVAGLLGLLSLFSSMAWPQSDSLDRIVATVNGEPITETDVQMRIRLLIFDEMQAGRTPPSTANARSGALDRAISQLVKRQQATLMGISISDGQIAARLNEIGDQNDVSPDELLEHFVDNGLTMEDVRVSLEENLIDESLTRRVLARRVVVREAEIDRYLKVNNSEFEMGEQYNLTIIVIPDNNQLTFAARREFRRIAKEIAFEIKSGADFRAIAAAVRQIEGIDAGDVGWIEVSQIDPEVLRGISGAGLGGHIGPVKSEGSMIFALVNDHRKSGRVELPEVREFQIARIVLISSNDAGAEVITEQMEVLRRNILEGADFGSLAKLYSHDNETRQDGGDMGWVSEDNLPFEYSEVLRNMEPGQISTVQSIGNAVYVLKLQAVRKGSYESSKRSVVREKLRNLKLRNESAKWVDQLRSAAVIKYRNNYGS